jgi:hypothetical protein
MGGKLVIFDCYVLSNYILYLIDPTMYVELGCFIASCCRDMLQMLQEIRRIHVHYGNIGPSSSVCVCVHVCVCASVRVCTCVSVWL